MSSIRQALPELSLPAPTTPRSPQRWLFLSSCPEPWGGSEELWAGAARRLAQQGHVVSACKTLVDPEHPRIVELQEAGIAVEDYWHFRFSRLQRNAHRLLPRRLRFLPIGANEFPYLFERRLRALAPQVAVISQGENFDGLHFVNSCRQVGIPYVLICQKASDMNWPADSIREFMRQAFLGAERVYFVSRHNLALTERQLAQRLPNAEVVRNPFQTPVSEPLPYPPVTDGRLRLACIARLFVLEKGQDMLLDVLAQPKWRARPIEVDFYGQGIHREALERAAEMLELRNVCFRGFTNDITEVWRRHHALVLPSRAEGLPLALVEAMLCGRPGIVTNAGGNAEVIEDGATGFLAKGVDAASLEETLERAWDRRMEWEQIGRAAAAQVRCHIPTDPCLEFTAKLQTVATHLTKAVSHA